MKTQFGIAIKLLLMCSVVVADDLSLTSTLVGTETDNFLESTSTIKADASDRLQNKSCEGAQTAQRTTAVGSEERVSCPPGVTQSDVVGVNTQVSVHRNSPLRAREIERGQSPGNRHVDGRYPATPAHPGREVYSAVDWRSELQDVFGDDNYDRMAAAYVTVKKLDQWIDATLEGYGLGQANRLMSFQLTGVNQKLNATLFSVWEPSRGLSAIEQSSGFQTNFDSKQLQDFSRQTQAAKYGSAVDSDLLVIMQYFTLINGLYAFLVFLGGYSILKAVRFLLKQDLSD